MYRGNNNSSKGAFVVIVIFFVIMIILIKWLFLILIAIMSIIISFISWIIKQFRIKKITNKPFKNVKIKEDILNKTELDLKQELNLFNKDIYNELFPIMIRCRGENYYDEERIKKYKQKENKHTCIVKGTNDYKVAITFKNNSDEIKNAKCTCPYFVDKKGNCKHIYTLLYKVKCSNNKNIIKNEIQELINGINEMIEKSHNYINLNKKHFKTKTINEFNEFIHSYDYKLDIILDKLNSNNLEDTLLKYLEELIYIAKDIKNEILKVMNKDEIIKEEKVTTTKNKSNSHLGKAIIAATILGYLDDNDINSEYTEEELDAYGLEEHEKELVRKGEYDPWNFEYPENVDDLSEDDFYYFDDK